MYLDLILEKLASFFLEYLLPSTIKATVALIIGSTVLKIILSIMKLLFSKKIRKNARFTTILPIVSSFIRYIGAVIILSMVLESYGFSLSGIILALGALGLGIAYGAGDIISAFINGVVITYEDSFRIGEYVKFDDASGNIEGYVEDFSIRLTTVRTFQNEIIFVPNNNISNIINFNRREHSLLYSVSFRPTKNIEDTERKIIEMLSSIDNPKIRECTYLGVSEISDLSITFLINVLVVPEDRFLAQRELNKLFLIHFSEEIKEHMNRKIA